MVAVTVRGNAVQSELLGVPAPKLKGILMSFPAYDPYIAIMYYALSPLEDLYKHYVRVPSL